MKVLALFVVCSALAACVSVREADTSAWVGAPISALDKHPVFITLPMVRTVTPDGTEIRNYINGGNIAMCSGGGDVYSGIQNFSSYSAFSTCMARFAACNNLFYVRGGKVQSYVPTGTGGGVCYTDERTRPGFFSATNI